MFLPLAVTPGEPAPGGSATGAAAAGEPADGAPWHGTDRGLLARRLPDFVHQVLNQGQIGPTAMLELQTTAESGPVTWVTLDTPLEHDEAFDLLPSEVDVRAVVAGFLAPAEAGVRVEFHVFRDEQVDAYVTEKIGAVLQLSDPVPTLLRLTRLLARALDLPYHEPPPGLLTRNGEAFRLFLQGLDNAMLLSGDLEIALPDDRETLMRPFADALQLDPGFGLALRVANATTATAFYGQQLDQEAVRRFLDRCYSTAPVDGEACVAVAEQLSEMGDDERAFAWLEHATQLDPPPARGLEHLGLLMARRGDANAARELWQKGRDLDGHPDFFSHLAQLAFAEGRDGDAWQLTEHGLWRLRERTLRAGEWDDLGRGAGVLLECLQAQLVRREAPNAIAVALGGLSTLLREGDRVWLGLCLLASGLRREARVELVQGLRDVGEFDVRDRAVRALLQLDVADFEARFARAADRATRARNPRPALAEFQLWLHLQPEFWPALYYSAIAKRRLGAADEALDLLAAALEVSPGQPDVQFEMAELFDRRRNPKRALELVEQAMDGRPDEPRFHGARARYLQHLGRGVEARNLVEAALADGIDGPELRKLRRRLPRA